MRRSLSLHNLNYVEANKENVPPIFKRSNSLPSRIFDNPFGWKRRKEINEIDAMNFSRAVKWLKKIFWRQDQFERALKRHEMMGNWFPNYFLRSCTIEIGSDYVMRMYIGSEGDKIIVIFVKIFTTHK